MKTVQVHLIIGTTLAKYLGLKLANFTVQVVIENEWNILECLFKKLAPKFIDAKRGKGGSKYLSVHWRQSIQ